MAHLGVRVNAGFCGQNIIGEERMEEMKSEMMGPDSWACRPSERSLGISSGSWGKGRILKMGNHRTELNAGQIFLDAECRINR